MAAAFVKTAEHFIIFQSQHLDADDQSLKSADKEVAEDHTDPVGITAFRSCQLQHHFHDGGMADGKRPDTDAVSYTHLTLPTIA